MLHHLDNFIYLRNTAFYDNIKKNAHITTYYDRYLLTKTKLKQGILRYCIKEKMQLQVILYNSTQLSYFVSSYFECSSKSMDKICSLTLLAFFESFRRIAEHTSPVTTNTHKLILNIRLTSDEIVSQLLKRTQ